MAFGIINGGLGLQLAGASSSLIAAYAVVSAIVVLLYIAVKLFTQWRARRAGGPRAEKIASHGPGGRQDKYSQSRGEEIELPRRPHGAEYNGGTGY